MKVGTDPDKDLGRVKAAKQAIGDRATLFVDANGAYRVQQALEFANEFAEQQVGWFEEPVSSDDLTGFRTTRRRAGAGVSDRAQDENGFREPVKAGLRRRWRSALSAGHAIECRYTKLSSEIVQHQFVRVDILFDRLHVFQVFRMPYGSSTEQIAIHLIRPPDSETAIRPARAARFPFVNLTDPISQLHEVAPGIFLYSVAILERQPGATQSQPGDRFQPFVQVD